MSTEEQWTARHCACPCGQGSISVHVVSPDHPWGGGSQSLSIDCPTCRKVWRLDPRGLVEIASEADYLAARKASERPSRELRQLVEKIVKRFFKSMTFATRKAEWEELQRLGFYQWPLHQYRKLRRDGQTVGEIARVEWSSPWVLEHCEPSERESVIALRKRLADLDIEERAALKRIVRRKLPTN